MQKLIYQIRNWRAHLRYLMLGGAVVVDKATAMALGIMGCPTTPKVTMRSKLNVAVMRNGVLTDLGCVSRRVVTTAAVNHIRDAMANTGAAVNTFKYHACGTGTAAESVSDTTLQAECTTVLNPDSTRAVGTQINSVSKEYTTVGMITFDGVAAVTESGVFSAASGGVLLDRSVFAPITADAIQFTYTLTLNDGG